MEREVVESAVMAVGGGATNNLENVYIVQNGGTMQQIHLHFHVSERTDPSALERIINAVKSALGKGETNGETAGNMPALHGKTGRH